MSGPGWHCDGCGDYLVYDETQKQSVSVAQKDLRTLNERYKLALRRIRDEAEDNRIAALADDALEPKVIEHGDRTPRAKDPK